MSVDLCGMICKRGMGGVIVCMRVCIGQQFEWEMVVVMVTRLGYAENSGRGQEWVPFMPPSPTCCPSNRCNNA